MLLIDIAIRQKSRAPMQTKTDAMITRVAGVEDDSRGKPNNRQVTVLSSTQWHAACADVNADLMWTIRRANLLLEGVEFDQNFVGKQIKIGDLRMIVTGETDPCSRMDMQYEGLTKALEPNWRGGVCCKVIADGRVQVGDHVEIID
jgi:MOSC domain-containing protein YiiM